VENAELQKSSECRGCLIVQDIPNDGLGLDADEGMAEAWMGSGAPSESACRTLLKGGQNAVALKTQYDQGLAVGHWLCAKPGASNTIMAMQYEGERQGGNFYRFLIRAWPQEAG
jgi:hypothetical protein